MRTRFLIPVLVILPLISGCAGKQENAVQGDFSGRLTEAEIAGGLLSPEILWKFGRMADAQLSPDGRDIIYNVSRYDAHTSASITDIFRISVNGGEPVRLTDGDGKYHNPRWHPGGQKIAYLSATSGSMQIWEMNADGSGIRQLSESEEGINSFEYSPDGSKILFTREVKLDQTPQELYPDLPQSNVWIISDLMYRHWDQWHDYAYSHIFVAEISNGKLENTKDIMPGESWDSPLPPYYDAAEICWSPDSRTIAYTSKKMKGKDFAVSTNSDIYLYDLVSGSTKNITDGMPGYDRLPAFSNDGKKIAWESMETPGYEADKQRLFVMDLESGKKEYLTEDYDGDVSHLVWGSDDKEILFISGIHATYQIFKIGLGNRVIQQITSGTHDYTSFCLSSGVLVGSKMSMSMATELFRIDRETGEDVQLTFINRPLYENIKMGKVEERWIKTTDNRDMLVWVIYPPDFDTGKKYPALLYCQGGPQSAVSQYFSYRWNFQIMAANGYIIVAPNRRGVPSFGTEWNRQISGDYGGQNMNDYLSAIDAMSREPFVDKDRLGAVGASYGGYSVFYLAGHHEGRFKAFISHCGVYNFESMYGATEETFFCNFDYEGAPWDRPKPHSYTFSPHLYVGNWDTPILIISGENDFRIPYTQSLEAFNSAQLLGVPSKLLIFPEENHWVLKPQNSILWQREFFGWLDKWLK